MQIAVFSGGSRLTEIVSFDKQVFSFRGEIDTSGLQPTPDRGNLIKPHTDFLQGTLLPKLQTDVFLLLREYGEEHSPFSHHAISGSPVSPPSSPGEIPADEPLDDVSKDKLYKHYTDDLYGGNKMVPHEYSEGFPSMGFFCVQCDQHDGHRVVPREGDQLRYLLGNAKRAECTCNACLPVGHFSFDLKRAPGVGPRE